MKAAQHTSYNKRISHWTSQNRHTKYHRQRSLVKVTAAGANPLIIWFPEEKSRWSSLQTPHKLWKWSGRYHWRVRRQVKNLKVGDRGFGRLPLDHIGAFAEYVAVDSQVSQGSRLIVRRGSRCCAFDCLNHYASLRTHKYSSRLSLSLVVQVVGGMAIPIAKASLIVITNGAGDKAERVLLEQTALSITNRGLCKTVSQVDYVLDTLGVETANVYHEKGGRSLRAMPNGDFAKRMNLPKWKQILRIEAGRKFDKMADKYGVHYHFNLCRKQWFTTRGSRPL